MKIDENIIFFPDGSIDELFEKFRDDLEVALNKAERICSKIHVYLIKNYLNYFPNSDQDIVFKYFASAPSTFRFTPRTPSSG